MAATDIVAAYQSRYGALRSQVERTVGALWDRYGGLSDADLARFVSSVVPVVRGAQAATDALVLASTSVLLTDVTGTGLVPLEPLSDFDLRGVPADEVYRRPFVEARTAISLGHVFDEAMRFGRTRATVLATSDVMLAQRSAMDRIVRTEQRVVGYRRVLTGVSCELCQIASTQRYHSGNLMPLHPACDCSVASVLGDEDPGQVLNDELLATLKADGAIDRRSVDRLVPEARKTLDTARQRVAELRAELQAGIPDQERETRVEKRLDRWVQEVKAREAKLARLQSERAGRRVAVRQHGELGPVLIERAHAFTSAADLDL